MRRVELDIPRLRRYSADVAFEVYGDLGAGVMDYDHPLPPGRVPLWPAAAPRAGHLLDGHLALRHLDSVACDGHLDTLHLEAEHLYPARPIWFLSPGYVFGRFAHAVRMFDGAGNHDGQSEPVATFTINEAPTAPTSCHQWLADGQTGQVEVFFEPGRFVTRAGN